jgi:hypothetical protein
MKTTLLSVVVLVGAFLASCTQNLEEPPVTETRAVPDSSALETGRTASLKLLATAPLYNLETIGDVVNPFGRARLTVNTSVPLKISGWAVDAIAREAASGVDIVIDQKPFAARYSVNRPDVAGYFHTPAYRRSGFELVVPATQLSAGQHSLLLRIIDQQGTGYFQSPSLSFDLH